jgi:two-component system phosphate regulon response regulator PhoB
MSFHILVVEDEPPLTELLRYNLAKEGFRVSVAGDGEEALVMVQENEPDLIVLDWMLPKLSGLDLCRRLRGPSSSAKTPIIMLTARGEEADRVRGLDAGADDYMVKPFSPAELIARVRAVLRRAEPSLSDDKLTYGGIEMDLAAHKVTRDGRAVHLGPTEYRLLQVLMERPTRVFSREQLLDRAWGRDIYVEERTVDVHIRRLRRALNADDAPDLIRTVRRGGYAIDIDAP